MKLTLISMLSALLVAPAAFAGNCDKDCDKCDKKDCEQEQSSLIADCGKCKKDKDKEEAKDESTLLAAGCKCKECKCDPCKCDKKDSSLLAEGKCKKECDKEKSEDESTLLAEDKCKKDKKDGEEKEEEMLLLA
jgi:hypothetical protein